MAYFYQFSSCVAGTIEVWRVLSHVTYHYRPLMLKTSSILSGQQWCYLYCNRLQRHQLARKPNTALTHGKCHPFSITQSLIHKENKQVQRKSQKEPSTGLQQWHSTIHYAARSNPAVTGCSIMNPELANRPRTYWEVFWQICTLLAGDNRLFYHPF